MTQSSSVGGKALNLQVLSSIPNVNVPPFAVVPVGSTKSVRLRIIRNFLSTNKGAAVAVRSSAIQEDSLRASFAGMFTTKLHVPATLADISVAIDEVLASWREKMEIVQQYAQARKLRANDQAMAVIVQEMLYADVAGVIFSHGLGERDGYYSISLTRGLGDAIVSGLVNGELYRIARAYPAEELNDPMIATLVATMRLIERHYASSNLDVEFAFTGDTLHILQCRPLSARPTTLVKRTSEIQLVSQIKSLNKEILAKHSGDILGDMIDINPLELLGRHPSMLDVSVFRYLFADTVAERVRNGMGYDPLHSGLVHMVQNKPYVSLRNAAFSFRPRGIAQEIYEKMYRVYFRRIAERPSLQASVEFNVFAMKTGTKLEQLIREASLSVNEQEEVKKAFHLLDEAIVTNSVDATAVFSELLLTHERRFKRLKNEKTGNLEECLATAQGVAELFVRVARLAFYWKNRFEETYSAEDLNQLLEGHIHSVSSRMENDLWRCKIGKLSHSALIKKYGHLRPGQFSVFGESYADDPERYLFASMVNVVQPSTSVRNHQFEETVEFKNVVFFMHAREETKFLLSKILDVMANAMKVWMHDRAISVVQASQLTLEEITSRRSRQTSGAQTGYGKNRLPLILPEVIIPGVTNLGAICFAEAAPTFVTKAVVKARICCISSMERTNDLKGAIVVIPSADPGYDFLFHSGVVGIVTQTGGPASHMCIRAIELQVPSCVGCGERLYAELQDAHTIVLDCAGKQIIFPR